MHDRCANCGACPHCGAPAPIPPALPWHGVIPPQPNPNPPYYGPPVTITTTGGDVGPLTVSYDRSLRVGI